MFDLGKVIRLRTKKEKLRIALVSAALIVLAVPAFLLLLSYNGTVARAINRGYAGAAFAYADTLASGDIGGGKEVCVYRTATGNIAAAVTRKGILGYRVDGISGTLPAESAEREAHISSSFSALGSSKTLHWGVLYDASLQGATVNDQPAALLTTDNGLRIWYTYLDRSFTAAEIVVA